MICVGDLGNIEGWRLRLRMIEVDDAPFVVGLRHDRALGRYLSPVDTSIVAQRVWLESYKKREAARAELYYVIERLDGAPCGLVRLYSIEDKSFEWGSWILGENKPRKAALESAILSFSVGFERLKLDYALIEVMTLNERASAFYRRFGMVETGRGDRNTYFTYTRERFLSDKQNLIQKLDVGVSD